MSNLTPAPGGGYYAGGGQSGQIIADPTAAASAPLSYSGTSSNGVFYPDNASGGGVPPGMTLGGSTPGGGSGFGANGLPTSFANALSQFNAPASSPFADLIAKAKQIAAARRTQIEGDYKDLNASATAKGAHDVAGAESLATRFSGPGLDTFMDSFVASKVAESDKRLLDLGKAKEKALTEADTEMLTTINDLSLKELQRNDQLRQAQIDNAFKLINTQQTAYEQSPDFLKMKAIFSDSDMLRAGVTASDTPDQIQAKLSKLPMTEEQRLQLDKLRAEIAAANRSNRSGSGAIAPASTDLQNVQNALASARGGDGYSNTGVYRQWKQTIESKYPGIDFSAYFPPSSWLNPGDQSALTLFGSKPGFGAGGLDLSAILNGGS